MDESSAEGNHERFARVGGGSEWFMVLNEGRWVRSNIMATRGVGVSTMETNL